jgi:shikimate kinase
MVSMSNIFLVGFMGAGKTSVAAALAARLGYNHHDVDESLRERFSASIPEIFEVYGEGAFRTAESEEIDRSTRLQRCVVATGGGAFCSASNREIIDAAEGVSVFLNLPWEVLCQRLVGDNPDRPMFRDAEQAKRLFEDRLPDYRLASITVDLAGNESPTVVADLVVGALRETSCAI